MSLYHVLLASIPLAYYTIWKTFRLFDRYFDSKTEERLQEKQAYETLYLSLTQMLGSVCNYLIEIRSRQFNLSSQPYQPSQSSRPSSNMSSTARRALFDYYELFPIRTSTTQPSSGTRQSHSSPSTSSSTSSSSPVQTSETSVPSMSTALNSSMSLGSSTSTSALNFQSGDPSTSTLLNSTSSSSPSSSSSSPSSSSSSPSSSSSSVASSSTSSSSSQSLNNLIWTELYTMPYVFESSTRHPSTSAHDETIYDDMPELIPDDPVS